MNNKITNEILILGGGLTGLSAGYVLNNAGLKVKVFESDAAVGGLSKTITKGDFRFDLGGHRFFTQNEKINKFVIDLMAGELLSVHRTSKIFMRDKFFDYPLKPSNAMFGLGLPTTVKIVADYGTEKIKRFLKEPDDVSLEDWVVANFGRTMFNIYFKEYSEKVWGIECNKISKEWVAQRIKGLSLWVAIKHAFFKFSGRKIGTLVDQFLYPPFGIGQISDTLKKNIEAKNPVLTSTRVMQINHNDFVIKNIIAKNCGHTDEIGGREFVSSIPLTNLVRLLTPPPPDDILEAASHLKYRDLVIVTIMLSRDRVTDLTWLYLPEQNIPIGRLHEPKNWSLHMAPEGKTHVVCEYFCSEGDRIWNSDNEELTSLTVKHLERLGFFRKDEVIDSCIVKVPHAYPLFETGYAEHYNKILTYLQNFKNLHIIGRNGLFRYYNMDHTIECGIEIAEKIIKKQANMNTIQQRCHCEEQSDEAISNDEILRFARNDGRMAQNIKKRL